MKTYYIENDGQIILFDTNLKKLQDTLVFMPHYSELSIQETERPIVNFEFGDTPEYIAEELAQVKAAKQAENDEKAYAKIDTITFTHTVQGQECLFKCNKETQSDLVAAAIGFMARVLTAKDWTASNGVTVELTQTDVATVLGMFDSTLNPIWAHWGIIKLAVENATNKPEVEAIVVDYNATTL